MAVTVNDILKVVWAFRVDGVQTRGQNVFHYKVTDLVSATEPDIGLDFVTQIGDGFTAIDAFLSLDYIAESLRITNVTKKEFVADLVPVFAGTALAGTTTPAQVAVEILGRARTLGHVGRKYVGPVTEAAHDDGVLTALALIDFRVFRDFYVTNFIGATTANDYEPTLVKYAPGGGIASTLPIDPDLGFVVQTARTMRSRIPGVGTT